MNGIPGMFSRIARHYDALNRLFSLGSDQRWRKIVARVARTSGGARILDACTGTADLALELARRAAPEAVIGVDLSEGMLAMGRRKVMRRGWEGVVSLQRADAMRLPFRASSFDAASIAFGLRNLKDRGRGIAELARVLKPGGKLLVLEFAPPRSTIAGRLFAIYLERVIPLLGGLIAGDRTAYRYLHDSIVGFLDPAEVIRLMKRGRIEHVRALPLTMGIAWLYRGVKAAERGVLSGPIA